MAYHITTEIIKDVESLIVKDKSATNSRLNFNDKKSVKWSFDWFVIKLYQLLDFLKRESIYPFKLLMVGFALWCRDFFKFLIFSLVASVIIILLLSELDKIEAIVMGSLLVPLSIIIPIVITIFSAPSSFSFCGIKKIHVDSIKKTLSNANIKNISQITLIKDNILIFEKRALARIIANRVFLAFCWGNVLTLYLHFNKLDFGDEQSNQFLVVSYAVLLALYILIECYSKVVTLIFRAAYVGCNEYEYLFFE